MRRRSYRYLERKISDCAYSQCGKCRSLYKFNDEDCEIAAVAGLLHDYGRFEQWTKYKTYNDADSIDHGDLGVSILFDDTIKNYCLTEKSYDEIYDAIKYHNKYTIPTNLTKHNETLCKVIRDADKLDILYLCSINKELLADDESVISDKVSKDFFNQKQINIKDVKTKNDRIILYLAMIYDINFNYSFNYLNDNNLIWKILNNINNKNKFAKYFDFIDRYVIERIGKRVKH